MFRAQRLIAAPRILARRGMSNATTIEVGFALTLCEIRCGDEWTAITCIAVGEVLEQVAG
jgi:hypothetical protein